jgi:hypothetical protein
LFELLEARVLYSADATASASTAGSLLPLFNAPALPQASLFGGAANRQVEVATVQASGAVGPFVRIDLSQLNDLRADATARRNDLFAWAQVQNAADPDDNDAGGEWASPSRLARRSSGDASDDIGNAPVVHGGVTLHSSTRIEMRAASVARAWNRAQAANDDFDSDDLLPPMDLGSDADLPPVLPNPVIAIMYHGDVIPLYEPVFTWSPGGSLFGSLNSGSASDGVSTGAPTGDAHVPIRTGSSSDDSAGTTMTTTSGDGQLYVSLPAGGGDAGAAQQLVASGGHVRSANSSGKAHSAVARGDDDDDARRGDLTAAVSSGASAARGGSRSRESVVAGDGDGSLIGGEPGAHGMSAGARGANGAAGISSSSSSLLGGGAAGDATVTLVSSNTIVVAANGISAVAAAANAARGSWIGRAAIGADAATGAVANGALLGARRLLEMARGVASAVEGVAGPLLPDAAEAAAAATGSATVDIAPVSATGMLLGLAPVWNWGGGSAARETLDPETLAKAWRIAAAGSLFVTMAGCWYCATAARKANRIRRRLAERARFATARRIRFSPRPA